MRLILLFVVVPLVELLILLQLAELISGWSTLALVIVTGFIGASLARWQGWAVFHRIQTEMQQGRVPTTSLVDALMIFVAGALLITPGLLTDLFGFSLLVPFIRAIYRRWLTEWFRNHVHVQTQVGPSGFPGRQRPPSGEVIDSFVVDPDETSTDEDPSKT